MKFQFGVCSTHNVDMFVMHTPSELIKLQHHQITAHHQTAVLYLVRALKFHGTLGGKGLTPVSQIGYTPVIIPSGKHVVSSLCNGLKISSAETQHRIGGYRLIKLSTHCQGIQGELILRAVVNAAQMINNHKAEVRLSQRK